MSIQRTNWINNANHATITHQKIPQRALNIVDIKVPNIQTKYKIHISIYYIK